VIETTNHLLLFGADWTVNRAAEKQSSQSLEKFKNVIVTLPGLFFFVAGVYHILNPGILAVLGQLDTSRAVLSLPALVVKAT
jgi:hypothetical protein